MGYLINAWNESQKKFSMTMKQIVNIAGDESLESQEAVLEMRTFFGMIDLTTLDRLLQECYSKDKKHKFDSRGFAFQDLVNEMGKRLGYKVENGLYRGKKNDIGFDGLWRHADGSCIIMESKASGDYAFAPETVIGYREELIMEQKISRKKCSILVVYGRDDKGTLRNAVKGSDGTSNIRLISSNALFQLVKIVSEAKSGIVSKQAVNLLKPRDYFVLDNLVELVFPETDKDIISVEDGNDEEETVEVEAAPQEEDENIRTDKMPVSNKNSNGVDNLPPLPDSSMKVGSFVFTAMKNLSQTGFEFSDQQLADLCADGAMKKIIGMQRSLPFLKVYDPNEENGSYIDGKPRYYREPLKFGGVSVYVNSQIYKTDREPFIMWYETLVNHPTDEAELSGNEAVTKSGLVPPLPDKTLKVGLFVKTAMENLSSVGFEFSDEQMTILCAPTSMHDVIGLTRKLPFFKIYDPNEEKGNYINGVVRYYSKPLTFGKYTVYLTKELFSADKEPFILWYENLEWKQ